jgi:hypothetical protein
MKKEKHSVLICIANYGSEQIPYLKKLLKEYNSFKKYKIKAIILATEHVNLNFSNLETEQLVFDKSLGFWLTHKHRKFIFENKGMFDVFIYSENDVLITERNLDTFLKHSENLKNTNYVPGFLRYEIGDGNKYLIDCHPNHAIHSMPYYPILRYLFFFVPAKVLLKLGLHPIIKKIKMKINGKYYFQVQNLHQGCYVLTKSQLRKVLDSGNYFDDKYNYAGVREGAASNVFAVCGVTKVISKDNLDDSLIFHMPNKYAQSHPTYKGSQVLTSEKLSKILS